MTMVMMMILMMITMPLMMSMLIMILMMITMMIMTMIMMRRQGIQEIQENPLRNQKKEKNQMIMMQISLICKFKRRMKDTDQVVENIQTGLELFKKKVLILFFYHSYQSLLIDYTQIYHNAELLCKHQRKRINKRRGNLYGESI